VTRGPRWAADGGNGSVVDMNESTVTSVRHLLNLILSDVDVLFPDVDQRVLEVVCVQFIATLIELQEEGALQKQLP